MVRHLLAVIDFIELPLVSESRVEIRPVWQKVILKYNPHHNCQPLFCVHCQRVPGFVCQADMPADLALWNVGSTSQILVCDNLQSAEHCC